jgi:hypothetical protein
MPKTKPEEEKEAPLSVREILMMPNIKLPERLSKIRNKMQAMIANKDEAVEYV